MDVSAIVPIIEAAAFSTVLIAVTVLTVLVGLKVLHWMRRSL